MQRFLSLLFFVGCCLPVSHLAAQESQLTLELVRTFNGHQGSKVEYVTFSPQGNMWASAGFDHLIHILNSNDQTDVKIINGHKSLVNHVVFSQTGTIFASASDDGTVKVWDTATGNELYSFAAAVPSALFKQAYFAVFSADERYLYFGGKSGKIYRVALSAGAQPEIIFDDYYHITCAVLSPDNRYLIFGAAYSISFLDLNALGDASNKKVPIDEQKTVDKLPDYVNDIQISRDGKTLAAWCENGTIQLWDYSTMKKIGQIVAGDQGYSHISFSSNGTYLASGNSGNGFKIWDYKTHKILCEDKSAKSFVRALQFSPNDDNLLLTGSYDGSVKLWRITNLKPPPPPAPPVVQAPPPPALPKENKLPSQAEIAYNDKQLPTTINDRPVILKANIPLRKPNVTLEVFDDEQEDGDIISLYFNGECILEKYTLVKSKKILNIVIDPEKPNTIVFYAHNLGKRPPNTCAIRLLDGVTPQMVNLSGDLNKTQAVNLYIKK